MTSTHSLCRSPDVRTKCRSNIAGVSRAGVTFKMSPTWKIRPGSDNHRIDMSLSYSNIAGPIKSFPITELPPEVSRSTIYRQKSAPPGPETFLGGDTIMRHRLHASSLTACSRLSTNQSIIQSADLLKCFLKGRTERQKWNEIKWKPERAAFISFNFCRLLRIFKQFSEASAPSRPDRQSTS